MLPWGHSPQNGPSRSAELTALVDRLRTDPGPDCFIVVSMYVECEAPAADDADMPCDVSGSGNYSSYKLIPDHRQRAPWPVSALDRRFFDLCRAQIVPFGAA